MCSKLYTLVVLRMLVSTVWMELLENTRDLGIQIDSKLKFHAHTNTVTKKLTVFWALSVNLLSVKIPMLLLDYIQLLYASSLNIIMFLWGPIYVLDNQKLERIQCRATRIICISSLTCCAYNCLICFLWMYRHMPLSFSYHYNKLKNWKFSIGE